MSGICGYINNKCNKQTINNMIDSIKHRGINYNIYQDNEYSLANLSHKQILNTKKEEDKKEEKKEYSKYIALIDGNIDKDNEIIKKYKLENESDENIIKELYIKFEDDFFKYIDGSFSIGLYDIEKNKLILATDFISTKPLYYYYENNNICFGSELKAIMQYPNFKKEINIDALSLYFRFNYINSPETIFKNTYKLENGHYLIFQNGKIEKKCYWNIIEKYNQLSNTKIKDYNEAKENLKKILIKNIKNNIRENEDIALYLSAGVDSSIIAALYHEISDKPINTFSIGFYDENKNEANEAKQIAKHLKTKHHEKYVDEKDFLDLIKKIPEYYDEPFADASEVPTILINEQAKQNNFKYALTGDGADSIFCGSRIYDLEIDMHIKQKIVNPFNIYIKNNFPTRRTIGKIFMNTDKRTQTQYDMISKDYLLKNLFADEGSKRYYIEDKIKSKSWQIKRMIVDIGSFLATRLNTKIDRTSNRNGIFLRSPFLSKELLEYSFKLPQKYKYYKKDKKHILKDILYEYVPKEFVNKTKKGFGIPLKIWVKKYIIEEIKQRYTKEYIEKQNIFNYNALMNLLNNKEELNSVYQIIWDFYIFQLWYEKYMI